MRQRVVIAPAYSVDAQRVRRANALCLSRMQINMTVNQRAHPPIVSPDECLAERKTLLGSEKEFTKHKDRLNAQRRRLPMARVEKTYGFDGPDGKRSLG